MAKTTPSPKHPIRRVLSLDGGGIRGLMTAIWLQALEDKLGGPLRDYFDLIAGTSTGAILACAISAGKKPAEIVSLYKERGMNVFPSRASRLWDRLVRLPQDGASAPKYQPDGLRAELEAVFADMEFGDLHVKPTLVTAYDVAARAALVFKNHKPEHTKLRLVDICLASSAAPTYFPCHVMIVGVDGVHKQRPLVDGGVVANNPTACAIAEAARFNCDANAKTNGLGDLIVASFGTGESTRVITAEEATEWGTVEWAKPIVDVLFDGAADAVDYIASQLIEKDRYFRFQAILDSAYDDMDKADAVNIAALETTAEKFLSSAQGKRLLSELATILKKDKADNAA
ncbi:Patatin [Pirellula staleyi DSM 6068]|uniref:Patatin n=1 Tax=Pirellula staleyi (strain ATCC 27377 / DSM 6068 / ICPB 4128) TaxID=530564 RepID=D2R0J5_PIRSD|nr:CBASS cGAMP-activated phospholipase [Pirellula staleyi]ADB14863.1 Patatin [Pirellula staleyi DSM 6068]